MSAREDSHDRDPLAGAGGAVPGRTAGRKSGLRFAAVYLFCLPLAAAVLIALADRRADLVDEQGHAVSVGELIEKDKSDLRLITAAGIWKSTRPAAYVPLEQLPQSLRRALIFQEDQAFLHHRGYSLREIRSALFDALFRFRRLRGASTITQQLARTLFLKRSNTLRRKLIELRIARILESELEKEHILELYLNNVYWGRNRYGIAAASSRYFGKSPGALTLEESAFLVALLPNPDGCQAPARRAFQECRLERIGFRHRRLTRYLKAALSPSKTPKKK